MQPLQIFPSLMRFVFLKDVTLEVQRVIKIQKRPKIF